MEKENPMKRTETAITTGIVRLSFAHVWEPHKSNEDSEPRYSAMLIIPKNDAKTREKSNLQSKQ